MPDLVNISKCPNCGHEPFDTAFCPECGQRRLTEKDLHIYSLVRDFLQGFLNFENSLLTTLRYFFTRPGNYAKEYNHGARKKFISPIKLFLLANAIYFIFPAINTFTTTLSIQMNGLIYSEFLKGFIESRIADSGMGAEAFSQEYNELTAILSKALLLILPVLFGISTWLLSMTRRKITPLIFHFNRSLIFHSFILLMVVSMIPVTLALIAKIFDLQFILNGFNDLNITAGAFLIMNVYGYFVYRDFFRSPLWINVIRVISLNLIFYILLFVYRFILLMVTLGWMELFG